MRVAITGRVGVEFLKMELVVDDVYQPLSYEIGGPATCPVPASIA